MNSLLNPVLEDADKFPSLLPLALAIEDAVDSPESSFDDIARIVESDTDLTARFLALANSSFYNYPVSITTIPDALSVIGLRNTRNMSIALSLPRSLGNSPEFPVESDRFWRHSIAVGLCTRLIALDSRDANTERHFLAGFFHKIGRPLIASLFPEEANAIYKRTRKRDTLYQKAAQSILGFDESEVGAAALQHWRFPENISTLVRHHNKPVLARTHLRGASFVHISSFIVSALNFGDSGDRFVPEFSEAAWGFSNFDESKLSMIVEELKRQLDSVCHVFLSENIDQG
ncbi:HDOD domain-containing protein [Pelagicoccus sp. SDUM812002]|uniref:HDOD domain-containing protein n=1 Tax=Pelagicoccus sp. SDUM812002 TaxID=3041266 RepID=UPI00280F3A75|nr:HDOD domain-containing protein [Pelagicoccus sp. SDUM812002]MDQ8187577.1 HDOD domain-containing protein [Pelagicoccus sp. SDUM812002]